MVLPQNVVWFVPLDLVESAMKADVIEYFRERHIRVLAKETIAAGSGLPGRSLVLALSSEHGLPDLPIPENRHGFASPSATFLTHPFLCLFKLGHIAVRLMSGNFDWTTPRVR